MTSHFNRYQGMYVQPAYKSVNEYNKTFSMKEKLLEEADKAIAWGHPDKESIGYTSRELIEIIRRMKKYIEAS